MAEVQDMAGACLSVVSKSPSQAKDFIDDPLEYLQPCIELDDLATVEYTPIIPKPPSPSLEQDESREGIFAPINLVASPEMKRYVL